MQCFSLESRRRGKGLRTFADLQFVYDKFAVIPSMRQSSDSFLRAAGRPRRLPDCGPRRALGASALSRRDK